MRAFVLGVMKGRFQCKKMLKRKLQSQIEKRKCNVESETEIQNEKDKREYIDRMYLRKNRYRNRFRNKKKGE
jgi:hypothetical protein